MALPTPHADGPPLDWAAAEAAALRALAVGGIPGVEGKRCDEVRRPPGPSAPPPSAAPATDPKLDAAPSGGAPALAGDGMGGAGMGRAADGVPWEDDEKLTWRVA